MARLEDKEMTLGEHLEELRRRLIVSLLAVGVGTVLCWGGSGKALALMARPVGGLIFVEPTEAFLTRFKLALFCGFLLALPVVLHQAWAFTACALGQGLRQFLSFMIPASYALFLCGAGLCVFVVVPAAMRFLIACGSSAVRPLLSVGPYVDFVTGLSMAFGAVFQLPLILIVLNRVGFVSRAALSERRRVVYLVSFIAAGLLTPGPDVVSQISLAIPMILLFEASLWAMRGDAAAAPVPLRRS